MRVTGRPSRSTKFAEIAIVLTASLVACSKPAKNGSSRTAMANGTTAATEPVARPANEIAAATQTDTSTSTEVESPLDPAVEIQPGPAIVGTLALEAGAAPSSHRVMLQTFDNRQTSAPVDEDGSFTLDTPAAGVPFTVFLQVDSGAALTAAGPKTIAAVDFGSLGFAQTLTDEATAADPIKIALTADSRNLTAAAEVAAGASGLAETKQAPLPDIGGTWGVKCLDDQGLGTSSCSESSKVLPDGFYLAQQNAGLSLWRSKQQFDRCSDGLGAGGVLAGSAKVWQSATTKETIPLDFSDDAATRRAIGAVFAKFPTDMKAHFLTLAPPLQSGDCGLAGDPNCVVVNDAGSPWDGLQRAQVDSIIHLVARMLRVYDDPLEHHNPNDTSQRDADIIAADGSIDCDSQRLTPPPWMTTLADCQVESHWSSDGFGGFYYDYINYLAGDSFPDEFCSKVADLYYRQLVATDFYGLNYTGSDFNSLYHRHFVIDGSGKFAFVEPAGKARCQATDQVTVTCPASPEATPAIRRAGILPKVASALCPNTATTLVVPGNLEFGGFKADDSINFHDCLKEFGDMTLAEQIVAIRNIGLTNHGNEIVRFACSAADRAAFVKTIAGESCAAEIVAGREECEMLWSDAWEDYVKVCADVFACERGLNGGCDFSAQGFLGSGRVESFGDKGAAVSAFTSYESSTFVFPEVLSQIGANPPTMSSICSSYGIPSGSPCSLAFDDRCTHNDSLTFVAAPTTPDQMTVTLTQSQAKNCQAEPRWTDGLTFSTTPRRSATQRTYLFELSR